MRSRRSAEEVESWRRAARARSGRDDRSRHPRPRVPVASWPTLTAHTVRAKAVPTAVDSFDGTSGVIVSESGATLVSTNVTLGLDELALDGDVALTL